LKSLSIQRAVVSGLLMSSVHEIVLPLRVIVGNGAIHSLVALLNEIKRKEPFRVGVVTGENTYLAGGRLVEEIARGVGDVYVLKVRDPNVVTAERVADEAVDRRLDVLIGVGGGKAIDVAKYAGFKVGVPVISVPLAPSHDGIASPFASLKGTDKPYSVKTRVPYAIVADTEIIARAPKRLILSGIGDLLGKFVSVKDWRLAHKLRGEYYGEYAAQLALLSAKHALRYHEVIAKGAPEGIRILVEALVSSGVSMCIAGSSRPASGSEHLFAHAIELLAPGKVLHGEAVALGSLIMLYIYGDPLWRKIKRVMKKIGLPTTAEELGLPPEMLVKALQIAPTIRPERYTILGERELSEEAAIKVLKDVGVI
jgi:glycerol-1-phosphate dehydrogenase [NAD(P)+]